MGTPGPYAWDPHLAAWVVLVVGVGLVVGGHRRLVRTGRPPIPWTRRQIVTFGGACLASVVALTWPVADLAAHWSLIALVTQRLILLMAVAPMLLLGLPYDVLQWITRPAPVDMVLTQVQRPLVAIATVTVLVIGSMTPVMVRPRHRRRWPGVCSTWSSWWPAWCCGSRSSAAYPASPGPSR